MPEHPVGDWNGTYIDDETGRAHRAVPYEDTPPMTKEKIYQKALEEIESTLCASDFRAGVSAMQITASKALAAAERLPPEPPAKPVDFDFACAAVRHFETYEYPPTWSDWPRALQALRNTVDYVNGRALNRPAEGA